MLKLQTCDTKAAVRSDGSESAEPEFEDVARLVRKSGTPLANVREAATRAWREVQNS
jgi:uncharacterized protein (DUF111 family)